MNVTLVGMAGAGKSYLGKQLAKALGYQWLDSDVLLSEAFGGKDIQTILDELGAERYLETEADICIKATTGIDGYVISPAGSVVYHDGWMNHLRDVSKVIHLRVPFDMVEARLQKVPPRAILGLGQKSLRELYDERYPLYEKSADLSLEPQKLSSDELVRAITDFLQLTK